MSSTVSQLSCFSTIQNRFHLANRSRPYLLRFQMILYDDQLNPRKIICWTTSFSAGSYDPYDIVGSHGQYHRLYYMACTVSCCPYDRSSGRVVIIHTTRASCQKSKVAYYAMFSFLIPKCSPSGLMWKSPTAINSDCHSLKASSSSSKSALKYTAKASKSDNDILEKPNSNVEEYVNGGVDAGEPMQHADTEPKRAARIHDFCFGIPYGAIVFCGGLVGFLFTRNSSSLMSGGLYGGALLALSIFSLKVWGQGQSSLPFILGQAGIAAALLWKNMQTYSLTKKLLPTGFSIVMSGAMLCFYAYVVMSGGNPPPKKLKSASAAAPS